MGAPTGEVTYLFTDVVGSTRLWSAHPGEMGQALSVHDEIIGEIADRRSGHVFARAGDSFSIAFSDAPAAVGAAVDTQRAMVRASVGEVKLRVRIGLHTGEALERDGNYYGPNVNRAAQIQAMADQSQILLSEDCVRLLAGATPTGTELVSIGEHRLRSLERPERLFQLVGTGLSAETTIQSDQGDTNLPQSSGRFVGRHSEVIGVAKALSPGRIVTLVGLGGLGKTRLAVEAARTSQFQFPDGIWWIDLAALTSFDAVATQIASLIGLVDVQPSRAADAVFAELNEKQALVVFDNCEHLVAQASAFTSELVARCPSVSVLATSRETLGLSAEQVWPLPPMEANGDAVNLLLERLAERDARVDTSSWDQSVVSELCARLDGIPLAIEMAAARLQSMSPRDVLSRIEDRFRLLRTRNRDASDRHQTMLATLDWSYELLAEDERLLLDRLSVFGETFDLAAAEDICSDDDLDEFDILDLLASLVDKSLVSVLRTQDQMRYRLLETVRHYAADHLSEAQVATLRDRHLVYFDRLLAETHRDWASLRLNEFEAAHARYTVEWGNARDAVLWSIASGDTVRCNEMLRSLYIYSFESLRYEPCGWAVDALELDDAPPMAFAMVAMKSGAGRGAELIKQALDRLGPDVDPNADACIVLSVDHGMRLAVGDPSVTQVGERALFHAPAFSTNDEAFHRAILAGQLLGSDPERATAMARQVEDFVRRSSNPMRSAAMGPLGLYLADHGEPHKGYEIADEGFRMAAEASLMWTESMALTSRARIALGYDVSEPSRDLSEALSRHRQAGAWYAFKFLTRESLPWLRDRNPQLADEVEANLGLLHRAGRPDSDGTEAAILDRLLDELNQT